MKKIIISLFALLIVFSCNQKSNNQQSQQDSTNVVNSENLKQENHSDFVSNFEQKTLPYTLDKNAGLYKNFSKLKYVEPKYLSILGINTKGELSKDEKGVLHYATDYFYKAYIKTDKDFDLFILAEYPYPPPEAPYIYKLYTFLPDKEKIIDKIEIGFFNSDESGDNESTLASIKNDLNIRINKTDTTYEINNDNEPIGMSIKTINKTYKITSTGTFKLIDSVSFTSEEILNIQGFLEKEKTLTKYGEIFKNTNSANDIKTILDKENSILDSLNNEIYKIHIDNIKHETINNEVKSILPFIKISYGAEASSYEAEYDYYAIYQKALQTPEKDDDVFFDAYKSVYPKISEQRFSDLGLYKEYIDFETPPYSKLGNGDYINAFKGIKQALAKETVFKDNIYNLEYKLLLNLASCEDFINSKEKVLDELTKIENELSFPDNLETKTSTRFNEFFNRTKNADNSHFNKKI